jgi:hypothetical protein
MAQQKSDEQKLHELQLKMNQLKEREKFLKAKASKKERADRTRRLIENGALAEKYLNAQGMSPVEFEILLSKIVQIENVKETINLTI